MSSYLAFQIAVFVGYTIIHQKNTGKVLLRGFIHKDGCLSGFYDREDGNDGHLQIEALEQLIGRVSSSVAL